MPVALVILDLARNAIQWLFEMKFNELITNIEKSRGKDLDLREVHLMKKLWNACVDCIAEEWPVLGDQIRQLKHIVVSSRKQD